VFIVIEGCDRFGKSTQVEMLYQRFVHCGLKTKMFSFPNYASVTGKVISEHLHDKIALAEKQRPQEVSILPRFGAQVSPHDALVFQCVQTCDKYAVASQISKVLRDGEIVVCGRWWQSAFVYGLDDGLDPLWLMDIHACMPQADLNLLLDFSPDEAAKRFSTPGDRLERDLVKQRRLRESYLEMWKNRIEPYGRIGVQHEWEVLQADGSPEEVHERIVDCVKNRFTFLPPKLV
jgi:Thymidylate kinase